MTAAPTILVVEDDLGDQVLIERALADSGVAVDLRVVSDGQEALDYLHGRGAYAAPGMAPEPALILLDLNLPKLDGRQVIESVRRSDLVRHVPIVVLSTSQENDDVRAVYRLGGNSYITKPTSIDAMVATMRELVRYWLTAIKLPQQARPTR